MVFVELARDLEFNLHVEIPLTSAMRIGKSLALQPEHLARLGPGAIVSSCLP